MFRRQILSVAALSTATLLLETTLTRLFAVAQFYHFAFLIISLALLGFGASGTLLSVFPSLRQLPLERMFPRLGLGFTVSVGLAYAVVNFLPFDSYSIAWDRLQIFLFALYYLVLTLPFIISGLGVGLAISQGQDRSHLFYASNLFGSGIGALLAPFALNLAGVPGAVLLSGIFGLGVSLVSSNQEPNINLNHKRSDWLLISSFIGGVVFFIFLTVQNFQSCAPLGMSISPYKGLSQVQRFPNSKTIYGRWSAISRLDLIADGGTHQMPGLSYLYPELPPEQLGLSLDGDALQAVTLIQPDEFDASAYLPESIAFEISPDARVLVLDPGGGLGVLQALAGGAVDVTAVQDNALIPQSIASASPVMNIYVHRNVHTISESDRVYLQREDGLFDIIYLPLTDAFRPITSGAYSLAENYVLTVESFELILSRLQPDGIFVFTRWMQIPPSESLRTIAVIIEALEQSGGLAANDSLVIFRGIQTVTVMTRPTGWPPDELSAIRMFAQDRKFDLVWMPDIEDGEVNQFNRLPEPSFYLAVRQLIEAQDRKLFYENYPYDISPPTDDNPFFFHFFTWQQTPEILATLGHTWQPFGGSGYFVLLALLVLTIILSFGLILFPLIWQRREHSVPLTGRSRVVIYFGLLGIAFLFIEIPLIQRWILLLGHPTYAFTIVVAVLLIFSGIGSALARAAWLPRRVVFGLLFLIALFMPFAISQFSSFLLSLPILGRLTLSVLSLAPLGILMGIPFPLGLVWLQERTQSWIPLAWAVNGCASVIASVLAAILSLSYGFSLVLFLGAGAYAGTALLYILTMKDQ